MGVKQLLILLCLGLTLLVTSLEARTIHKRKHKHKHVKRESPPVVVKPALPIPTKFLTAPLCPNKLDMVVVIDSSGSVQDVFDEIIDDVETFISNFDVDDAKTRISIIEFSAVANVISHLDRNNNQDELYSLLENVRVHPQNGETWIEYALDRATEVFAAANPQRPSARKVLVMYSDGVLTSQHYDNLKDLLFDLEHRNVDIINVAVNNNTFQPGLQMMASSHLHIYHMKDTESLYQAQPTLVEMACWGSGASQSNRSKCLMQKDNAIESNRKGVTNDWVPNCDNEGNFETIQGPWNGRLWCVDHKSGYTLPNVQPPSCAGDPKKDQTKCQLDREMSLQKQQGPPPSYGVFIPVCTDDGHYNTTQSDTMGRT